MKGLKSKTELAIVYQTASNHINANLSVTIHNSTPTINKDAI